MMIHNVSVVQGASRKIEATAKHFWSPDSFSTVTLVIEPRSTMFAGHEIKMFFDAKDKTFAEDLARAINDVVAAHAPPAKSLADAAAPVLAAAGIAPDLKQQAAE